MPRKIKPEKLSAEINNQIQGWSKELREEFGKIAENKGKDLNINSKLACYHKSMEHVNTTF